VRAGTTHHNTQAQAWSVTVALNMTGSAAKDTAAPIPAATAPLVSANTSIPAP
jgi:hypothetical protein